MSTTTPCKNCENIFEGNYCNNCGQDAHTHPINWHYLSHDIQHGIFHVDKGLLFSLKELYTRPGATIREFIAGKRVKHFKPVAMVFLLATIYGFFYNYLGIELMPVDGNGTNKVDISDVNHWIATHYAIATLAYIPFYSLASYLAFKKSRYNFIEHIVLNCFIAGQKFVIQFLLLPIIYYTGNIMDSRHLTIGLFIDFAITFWVYIQFFNSFGLAARVFRAVWSYILFAILTMTIITIVTIIHLMLKGH